MSRAEFSKPTRREALKRANGICECHLMPHVPGFTPGGCGQRLGEGNTFFEHIAADGAGGGNGLDNCAALTKTCWQIKTRGYDQPVVAKTKRQRERKYGIRRRSNHRPLDGSKASRWRKPMNGPAERRM